MAIYLGSDKVSPMFVKTIEKTVTINNGTTTTTYNTDTNFVLEDPDNLASDLPVVTEWTRPSGWPNLDALPELTEGVYLTYDNTSKVDYKWACFYCDVLSSGLVTIAQGHINGSSFVLDATWNVNTATYKEINYSSSTYDYVIFKITPTTASKHMTSMYFGRVALATLGTIALRPQQDLHCLERRGWLPYVTSVAGSGDNIRYCTEWMENDNVVLGTNVTSMNLSFGWYRARRLRKINFEGWPTQNWNVTTLLQTFDSCHLILKLDLSSWNTTNWHVTTLYYMFSGCYHLKVLLVPFNTINWGNTSNRQISFQGIFSSCHSLEQLDLSSWNVSNLVNTSLNQTWYCCYHLKSLNVKNWDTSKWIVNSLYYTWGNCRSLVDIDLSNWLTCTKNGNTYVSAWAPTRADCMFYNNQKRRNFDDIKHWDTYNWKIVQFNDAFGGCYRILELDLSGWDTSQWKVSTLSNTFGSCYNLRHLRVGTWDTSLWVVTNLNYLFTLDFNLEEFECFNWDTSNWVVSNGFYYAFAACLKLKELDFTKWTTTKWNLSASCDLRYFALYCYDLRKINLSNLNVGPITSLTYYGNSAAGTASTTPFYCCYNLEELTLPQNYKGHIDLSNCLLLSRTEIVKAFNALATPIGDNTAKVWISSMKYKLTTADIAIATNKGYTVVQ